jgi:hypothetical protein
VVIATLAVVFAGVASVIVRTGSGDNESATLDIENILLLLLVATPSLVLVPLTRRWRVWSWVCGLAVVAWLPLIGPAGDMSCTDCAFVLLLPVNVGLIQLILLVVALLSPTVRSR